MNFMKLFWFCMSSLMMLLTIFHVANLLTILGVGLWCLSGFLWLVDFVIRPKK